MNFRIKLILSYTLVSIITLILSLLLFTLIAHQFQQEQRKKAEESLSRQTQVEQQRLSELFACPPRVICQTSLDNFRTFLDRDAALLNVRILMVDEEGRVRIDTANASQRQNIENTALEAYKLSPRSGTPQLNSFRITQINYIYYALPGPRLSINTLGKSEQALSQKIALRVNETTTQTFVETDLILAVEETTLDQSWNNLLGGLLITGAIVLIFTVGLALLIARGIVRPLQYITLASAKIAQGNYDEQLLIKSKNNDEISQLAISFNKMVRAVAQSQQSMRDFVANVSHELKTPLTSIQGYSQAIFEGIADDPHTLHHSAVIIHNEATRMRRLVDELLDLSRIEARQAELKQYDIDLGQLLTRVIMRITPMIADKGMQLHPYLEKQRGLIVKGDPDRLEQIFTNLLDNAIKYGRAGSPIRLDLQILGEETGETKLVAFNNIGRNKPAQLTWLKVSIGNYGPLIPDEQLERIFERFYKLDRARKRNGESTGLGLAIVRELVELHEGTITVASRLLENSQTEGYTVFTVMLPLWQDISNQPTNTLPGQSDRVN